MRVSIVNPKKSRKGKKGQTKKQRAASIRNLKKARKAHAKGGKRASTRKSRPKKARKGKRRKSRKAKKPKKRKAKKARKSSSRKGRKAKKSRKGKSRKSRKGKKRKARKGRKGKKSRRGKKVRPVMYQGRSKKGKKVLRHSPKSRYARKGYRFNPLGQYVPGARKHMVSTKGAKLDLPHLVGAAGGFATSGITGGAARVFAQKYTSNDLVVSGVSLLGNYAGAEVPAMVVHWALGKAKVGSKVTEGVCRGMRIGGYVAMGLNAATIVLRTLNVNLPFRALSDMSATKDLLLSGVGDVDLALAGLGDLVRGNDFVATDDYAGLGADEGLLDAEIAALSAYVGDGMDDFGASVSDGSGLSI